VQRGRRLSPGWSVASAFQPGLRARTSRTHGCVQAGTAWEEVTLMLAVQSTKTLPLLSVVKSG
jgi:hypothetical protein